MKSYTHSNLIKTLSLCLVLMVSSLTVGQEPKEEDYYRMLSIPTPEGVVLEAGGMEWLPNGQLAVSSRRGDVYLFSNPLSDDVSKISSKKFIGGLHEVLGLSYRDGSIYATQRGEVTKLTDTNKDGRADIVETISDKWGINGDYHEYAFGSKFDKNGDMWVVLCLTGSFNSNSKYRGWCLRVSPDGTTTPTCSGIRSPGGIGLNAAGDVFYTDNQGPWNGFCSLKWLRPGSFQGHPGGNKWYSETNAIGKQPKDPISGSRIMTEADKIPEYEPPAVHFPYKKMGQSAAGIMCDQSKGKFGPFKDQLFVCDQTFSTVMRVHLEMVQGHYQGACFPFRSGFGSGSLTIQQAPDGSIFVGGTNRGWGSRGRKPFAIDRLTWTGKTLFEIHEMNLTNDGFKFSFTEPIDPASAADLEKYDLQTYTVIFQSSYGSPEVDHTKPVIKKVTVADDGLSMEVQVEGMQRGHIHEFKLNGIRSAKGIPLLHKEAYYTLNYFKSDKK